MQTGVEELKLVSSNQPVGEMYNINDERDGQLELEFNLPATADDWAILQINEHQTDQIETRVDVNSGKLIFELKDSLYSWMLKDYYQPGDKMTLTITGLCAKTDNSIRYGTSTSPACTKIRISGCANTHTSREMSAENPAETSVASRKPLRIRCRCPAP